jgi:RNA polymerase sigma-70 factor (ECF subfamily)
MATPPDIETLLARVALGDRGAFKALYEQTSGVIMATAYRVLQNRDAAEDVVQEVFASLWNHQAQAGVPQTRTLAWLCVVARNRALDQVRKRPKEEPLHFQNGDGEDAFHDAPSDAPGVFEQLSFEQEHQRLKHCLGQLDTGPREAVLLAYMDGLTHMELAERLRRPLGTIKAWTRRSLMALKLCMEPAR